MGGPVAFDRIVNDPNSIPSTQSIDRFFLETANSLGAHFNVPSLHAKYADISPDNFESDFNVYTIYFSYYKDYGWPGTVVLTALVGFLLTVLYNSASNGRPALMVLCAVTSVGTLSSIYSENYFLALNELIKISIFFAVLYHGPLISFSRRKRFAAAMVPSCG
jgi:oligosaccharide repeat unit polymerase